MCGEDFGCRGKASVLHRASKQSATSSGSYDVQTCPIGASCGQLQQYLPSFGKGPSQKFAEVQRNEQNYFRCKVERERDWQSDDAYVVKWRQSRLNC